MYRSDTIAAISTPPGKGGVAMLRVSGHDAADIASRCFFPKSGALLADLPARRAVYGDILCLGSSHDTGIAVLYRAPHSFTGEDVVEICCHGGVLVTRRALDALFCAGARQAEPGEFSKRALINGKMSLCDAEAFSRLLSARTDAQLRLALAGTDGKLTRELEGIYEKLASVSAALYAKIDFPDEDLADMTGDALCAAVTDTLRAVTRLTDGYTANAPIREGVPTVICGLPNTGKSSLYNALAGADLAIVTDEAGTTRDVLCSEIAVGRVLLRLSDTAGVREAAGKAEELGVRRALEALSGAALILLVFDGSRPLTGEDRALMRHVSDAPGTAVAVIGKSDLPQKTDADIIRAAFAECVTLSAKTGEGLEALSATIKRLFDTGAADMTDYPALSSARQFSAALRAKAALETAKAALERGFPPDCAATDVEDALAAIGELDGRTVCEDIVARIFSEFCVGK